MKTIKTTILILILCVMNQYANAQPSSCPANKVRMHRGDLNCQTKCVNPNQVQNYLNAGWIYGACWGGGPLRLSQNEIAAQTTLTNIYPNPVFSTTTIFFTLSEQEKVSLKIFDIKGRLVSTLANKIFEAGEIEITWNVANVNGGIYFLQFQSGENLQTEKLIVTK